MNNQPKNIDIATVVAALSDKYLKSVSEQDRQSFVNALTCEVNSAHAELERQLEGIQSGLETAMNEAELEDMRIGASDEYPNGTLSVPFDRLNKIKQERRRDAPWLKLGYGKVAMETIEVATTGHHAIVFSTLDEAHRVGTNLPRASDATITNKNNVVLSFASEESANALISLILHCVSKMPANKNLSAQPPNRNFNETNYLVGNAIDEAKWPKTWGDATVRLQDLAKGRAHPSELLRCAQLITQAARGDGDDLNVGAVKVRGLHDLAA